MTHALSSIIDLTNAPTPPRWFEFLLEPGRLQQHLETTGCDPSPIQLIALFFRNILSGSSFHGATNGDIGETAVTSNGTANNNTNKTNITDLAEKLFLDIGADADGCDVVIPPDSYEVKYRMRKTYALQTLSVKVASFLKWDLDKICDGLTIPIQYKLMQALTAACSNEACPPEVKKFASVIYCHWFLRSSMTYRLSTLQSQSSSTTIIYLSQLQQQQQTADNLALMSMGELFSNNSKQLKNCSDELHTFIMELTRNHKVAPNSKKLKTHDHPFKKAKLSRPKMECFDSRDEQFNDWTQCETIEPFEFFEAACYDLGRFFFFEESYSLAKESFEIIKRSSTRYPLLEEYLKSANDILTTDDKPAEDEDELSLESCDNISNEISTKRKQTEKYLFDCMTQYSQSQKEIKTAWPDKNDKNLDGEDEMEEDSDLRYDQQALACQHRLAENSAWYLQVPIDQQQQQFLEVGKGDILMARGNFKQAMGCFVGALMLMTDFFRIFSKNYVDEEPYITRMIQCSISLSCYTQAVALCQMTKNLNYTIAFNQLNERICNDCCDDIYECIWNVTLLEYIISLHAKRGEVERRTKVIQLIGQLELNENNPEEILQEAEHVRRGRFFRIMSNKYL